MSDRGLDSGDYRFLDPWTLLLPEGTGCVLAAVGSGGKSEVLSRLYRHYRGEGARVLWTQTVPHPAPPEGTGPAPLEVDPHPDAPLPARSEWERADALFVAGTLEAGRYGGLPPARIESIRKAWSPDVVLVESQSPTGTPLRLDSSPVVWPLHVHLAFLVASLGSVGSFWGPDIVAGSQAPARKPGQDPRRVQTDDVLDMFVGEQGLLAAVPKGALPIPMLTGFGAYRDMDGMFELVQRLWEQPGVKAVCLAELIGDRRRDTADAQSLPADIETAWHGERIYTLYPASLDED